MLPRVNPLAGARGQVISYRPTMQMTPVRYRVTQKRKPLFARTFHIRTQYLSDLYLTLPTMDCLLGRGFFQPNPKVLACLECGRQGVYFQWWPSAGTLPTHMQDQMAVHNALAPSPLSSLWRRCWPLCRAGDAGSERVNESPHSTGCRRRVRTEASQLAAKGGFQEG